MKIITEVFKNETWVKLQVRQVPNAMKAALGKVIEAREEAKELMANDYFEKIRITLVEELLYCESKKNETIF